METRIVPGGEELVVKAGSVSLTNPVSGVVVFRMAGHVTAEAAPALVLLLDRFHRAAPISVDFFYDLASMRAYDSPIRVDLTHWHLRHRGTLRSLHTVAESTIVRMGVTVASLALGGIIHQHRDRESFEAALSKALAQQKTA